MAANHAPFMRSTTEPAARSLQEGMSAVGGGLVAIADSVKGGVRIDLHLQLPPAKETLCMAAIIAGVTLLYVIISRSVTKTYD
ncbi:Uncharacterized protein PBTT_07192 [Plasmodiophora brassicae]